MGCGGMKRHGREEQGILDSLKGTPNNPSSKAALNRSDSLLLIACLTVMNTVTM